MNRSAFRWRLHIKERLNNCFIESARIFLGKLSFFNSLTLKSMLVLKSMISQTNSSSISNKAVNQSLLKKIYLLIAVISVIGLSCPVCAEVNEKADFQFWNQQSLKIPLTVKWDIKGVSEFRYGDNASFFFEKYYQGQLIYKFLVWLSLSPGYKQIWTRSKDSLQWTPTYVPFFEAVLHGTLACWGISNRARAACHIKESKEKKWVFRDRLTLVTPLRVTRLCISPYISEEVFFKQEEGFFQSRFAVGLSTLYSRNFTSKLFYLLRSDKNEGKWRHQNVVGLHFDFSF